VAGRFRIQREINYQPKQSLIHYYVTETATPWIGMPGGRGGAKSGCIQRLMLDRRTSLPGTSGAIVMRNYDQVRDYHINIMIRDYPELEEYYYKTDAKIVLPCDGGKSEIHFSYAETLNDVIRRFRSASFYDIMVDQAEQFTEAELREMKQACRWAGAPQGACKFLLAFNMGGAGIDFLRKKFHLHEYNKNERADQFASVHVFPWDNVEWVRPALEADGLTEDDYYSMTEQQRMEYCAQRSDYGGNLVSQDEPLVKRDWLGSWDALEGTYFGRVWDRDSVVIDSEQFKMLVKPWWTRWMSQDWGKGHFCPTLWHARGDVPPDEARGVLGWELTKPIRLTITYRQYVAGGAAASDEGGERELAEKDIAREMLERTPAKERPLIRHFYLSPDAFELSVRRQGQSQIAQILGGVLREGGLPYPTKADNQRVDGWSLMYNMLLSSKRHGSKGDEAWLITGDCADLSNAIPLLPRDPDNLNDVLKTDKGKARVEQDLGDGARYGLKSMISPGVKPVEVEIQEQLAVIESNTEKHLERLRLEDHYRRSSAPVRRGPRFVRS
jgi:hypothetical protein